MTITNGVPAFATALVWAFTLALAGCTAPAPRTVAADEAAARPPACKRTRNIRPAGPQTPASPPRCADSPDAGRLPAAALPPIVLPY